MTVFNSRSDGYRQPNRLAGILFVTVGVLVIAAGGALVAGQQPMLAIAAALSLPLLAATLKWPDVATLITIFILYSNAAVVAVKFHDVPFVVGATFPLLLGIPLAAYMILRREKLIFTAALPYLLLFLFVQFLGTLFAENVDDAFSELTVFIIEGLGIYFLITNVVRTQRMLRRVVWVLLITGVLMSAVPIVQQVTDNFENDFGGFGQTSERGFRTGEETVFGDVRQDRLAGSIGEQNRFAQVLLMLIPLGFLTFWQSGEESKSLRYFALMATLIITAGVLLTFSRGGAVGLFAMVLAMAVMRLIRVRQLVLITLVAILVMTLLPQYGTRLSTLQDLPDFFSPDEHVEDSVFTSRTTEMIAAFMVFADHPIVGVGPGMFKFYSAEYGNRINPGVLEGTRESHNLYLGIAADNGLLGIITFLAIIAVTIFDLRRKREVASRLQPKMVYLLNAFILSIITYLTTGFFLHLSYARYLWFILALAGAAGAIVKRTERAEEDKINNLFLPYQPGVNMVEGEAL